MNNNKHDKAALEASCRGVFSATGYLSTGKDMKYEDPLKTLSRDSEKGKQFLVPACKTGKTLDTFFGLDNSKKHLYIAQGLPYADRVRFAETQPNKPGRGFLTSDYTRSGEFTDTIRTEQYRAQLRQEARVARAHSEQEPHELTAPDPPPPQQDAGFLYDRVFDLSRPGREAQKLPRDTSNPTMLAKDRHLGGYNTTYLLAHSPAAKIAVRSPEHARRAIVRDTFYEKDLRSHAYS